MKKYIRSSRSAQLKRIIENTIILLEGEDDATYGDGESVASSGGDINDFDGNGKKFKGLVTAYQEAIDTADVVKLVGVLKSVKKHPDIRDEFIKFMKSARYADKGGPNDDVVTSSSKIIKPSLLSGTQNEIDFHKSVAFPFAGAIGWNGSIKKAMGAKVTPKSPVFTAGEKLVIDGHHRWSSTLAVNPEANLDCVDFSFPSSVTQNGILNAMHSAIAAASDNPDGFQGSQAGAFNIGENGAPLESFFDSAVGQNCQDKKLSEEIFCGNNWIAAAKENPLNGQEAKMLGFASEEAAAKALEGALDEGDIVNGGWKNCPFRKVVIEKIMKNLEMIAKKISSDAPSRLAMPQTDSKSVFGKDAKDDEMMRSVADQLASGNVHIDGDFEPEKIKESAIINRWNKLAGTLLKD